MIYKILYRKLPIEQHEPNTKNRGCSVYRYILHIGYSYM
jgi:hypothetical protein